MLDARMTIVFELIVLSLVNAMEKHKTFPTDMAAGLSVITEEVGELAQAINDCTDKCDEKQMRAIQTEATHVAVTAIRFIYGLKIPAKEQDKNGNSIQG